VFCKTLCALLVTFATPALALDLNSFRAQHGRPALGMSAGLAGLAYEQTHAMALRRNHAS
jgi:uncharacterized protein YkwD